MDYFVQRGEQQFGPYSLAELQQYVKSGNISSDDLARSEAMTDWVPVAQVIGNIEATEPGSQTGSADGSLVPDIQQYPVPNKAFGLHWLILLVLGYLTQQLLSFVYIILQAVYVKEIHKESWALFYCCISGLFLVATYVLAATHPEGVGSIFGVLGYALFMWIAMFSIRSSMVRYYNRTENIRLKLSWLMTFFFGVVYLQYHFNRIRKWKLTGELKPQ